MRKKLDQWRELPIRERALLARLVLLLPIVGGLLRLLGVQRTYRLLERSALNSSAVHPDDGSRIPAERLGRLVGIASRNGPYSATCLRQSLVVWWMLRRRGLPAELRIGVAKDQEHMYAHAWVELSGQVINDRPTIADDYAVYEGLDLCPPDSLARPPIET